MSNFLLFTVNCSAKSVVALRTCIMTWGLPKSQNFYQSMLGCFCSCLTRLIRFSEAKQYPEASLCIFLSHLHLCSQQICYEVRVFLYGFKHLVKEEVGVLFSIRERLVSKLRKVPGFFRIYSRPRKRMYKSIASDEQEASLPTLLPYPPQTHQPLSTITSLLETLPQTQPPLTAYPLLQPFFFPRQSRYHISSFTSSILHSSKYLRGTRLKKYSRVISCIGHA